MATYSPAQLGIKPPSTGFAEGGWYSGRQYWGGTLSDPGVIHPMSNQQGAGQAVSAEVNLQSDQAQGNKAGDIERYLAQQRQVATQQGYKPTVSAGMGQTSFDANAGMSGAGVNLSGMGVTPAINLPDIYKNLYATSGITEKEAGLVNAEKQYLEAKAKISDDPYLNASMLDQRLERLKNKYDTETAPIRNEIAMKKADIETQLNLQTKQFDINSQSAKDALNYFNTLLDAGALSGASGEDIANITRMTGLSSSIIQSAINTSKSKNANTQVITSTADNGEVTVSVIDKNTGAVVNQSSLGQIGNKQQGRQATESEKNAQLQGQFITKLEATKNDYGHIGPADWQGAMASWIARGGSREDFISNFQQYADPNRGDFDKVYYQRTF